jgi:hypothetical protein
MITIVCNQKTMTFHLNDLRNTNQHFFKLSNFESLTASNEELEFIKANFQKYHLFC